jgi:hypothetical protein
MHDGASSVDSTMHPAWIPRCIQRGFHDASSSVDSTMHHPAWIPRCIIQGGFHDASSRVDSTMHPAWIPRCIIQGGFRTDSTVVTTNSIVVTSSVDSTMHHPGWIPRCALSNLQQNINVARFEFKHCGCLCIYAVEETFGPDTRPTTL